MNRAIALAALALLERRQDFAWVSILDTHGSSPGHPGASMLVTIDGLAAGTIGGGPLEATCITAAKATIAEQDHRLLQFDSGQLGMACGGGGHVLIEYLDGASLAAHELFDALAKLWDQGLRGWLVTVPPEQSDLSLPVRRCLVDSAGQVTGVAVRPLEQLQALADRGGAYDSLAAEDPARLHVQALGTHGKAYVFGAGHCGHSLVPLLTTLGFHTTVIDDRAEFANQVRFPTADRIQVAASFAGVMQLLDVDDNGYLIILTRGHAHDQTVLAQALHTPAAYIGMIGSQKKVAKTFKALGEEGFSAEELARVHAPIGLSIGAETPEEIAVSIAAELIQVRSSRMG